LFCGQTVHASAVDDDVKSLQRNADLIHHLLNILFLCHITAKRYTGSADTFRIQGKLPGFFGMTAADRDIRAAR
jgi:hypothetical protein